MIDSSDVISYDNGWQAGYEMGFSDCKEKLMKVLRLVALRAVEKENPGTVEEKIEKIILYRWNRVYPADVHFPIDFSGWKLVQAEEFAGSSHEKITEEIYERVK